MAMDNFFRGRLRQPSTPCRSINTVLILYAHINGPVSLLPRERLRVFFQSPGRTINGTCVEHVYMCATHDPSPFRSTSPPRPRFCAALHTSTFSQVKVRVPFHPFRARTWTDHAFYSGARPLAVQTNQSITTTPKPRTRLRAQFAKCGHVITSTLSNPPCVARSSVVSVCDRVNLI